MALFTKWKESRRRARKRREAADEEFEEIFQEEDWKSYEQQEPAEEVTAKGTAEQLVQKAIQLDQKKQEYEQVTAYLTDIQRIEQTTEQEQEEIQQAAAKIVLLCDDRQEMKQENQQMTQLQYKFIQLHEAEIADGIAHIAEQEKVQTDIRSDMHKLEQEQQSLKQEERYYREKLNNLRMITWSCVFLTVIACGIIIFLYTQYIFDIFLAILAVLVAVSVLGTLIFIKYRNVNYALAYCRKQQQRARQLVNKVKIKSVRNISTLDYLCAKYNVGSARELACLWQLYQQRLENEEKYKRTSNELAQFSEVLVKQLKNVGVHDAEIWTCQAEALIDRREMVEVTHNLNARRQNLRETMGELEDTMEYLVAQLKEKLQNEPEQTQSVQELLRNHNIILQRE